LSFQLEFSGQLYGSSLGTSLLDCYTSQVYAVPITNRVLRVTFVCRVDRSSSVVNFLGLIDSSRLCVGFTGRVYESRLPVRIRIVLHDLN